MKHLNIYVLKVVYLPLSGALWGKQGKADALSPFEQCPFSFVFTPSSIYQTLWINVKRDKCFQRPRKDKRAMQNILIVFSVTSLSSNLPLRSKPELPLK